MFQSNLNIQMVVLSWHLHGKKYAGFFKRLNGLVWQRSKRGKHFSNCRLPAVVQDI